MMATSLYDRQKSLWPHLNLSEFPLPSAWNVKDKFSLLELSHSNFRVHYKGQGKADTDAAAIRANHPIPHACGVYYFEIKIIDKGRDGYIGIGFCSSLVSLNRLPGWDKQSWGYHGDDGNSFCSSSSGTAYGPTFTTGDVIGCCIDYVDNLAFYTKNGVRLGVAFRNFKGKVYPTVGLRTQGEVVEANFGQDPFLFDLEGYIQEVKLKVTSLYSKFPICSESLGDISSQSALTEIVSAYLVHQGYTETAQLFARDTNSTIPESSESIRSRHLIREHVLAGRIDDALSSTQTLYPGVLESRHRLVFQLKIRKFIEMVREASATSVSSSIEKMERILTFGNELQMLSESQDVGTENTQRLEEAFSLIAYPDPSESPVGYVLDPIQRDQIATGLNSAILEHQGYPGSPALEKLIRQASVVNQEMIRHGIGSSAFVDLSDFF